MIVDSSAVIAIVRDEADAEDYARALVRAASPKMSAATFVETAIVVDSRNDPVAVRRFDQLIDVAAIDLVPVTRTQAILARAAYRDYGKRSGHPAGLNFGDCFSYALAAETGESLLFKGDDFGHTDVTPALPAG